MASVQDSHPGGRGRAPEGFGTEPEPFKGVLAPEPGAEEAGTEPDEPLRGAAMGPEEEGITIAALAPFIGVMEAGGEDSGRFEASEEFLSFFFLSAAAMGISVPSDNFSFLAGGGDDLRLPIGVPMGVPFLDEGRDSA